MSVLNEMQNPIRPKLRTVLAALDDAPKWHYHAGNASRRQLEAFMEEYCIWHNSVRAKAAKTVEKLLADIPDPYREHDL